MKSDRDSIKDVWGPRTPFGRGESWPERVDAHLVDEPERWVKSACVLCSTGCALELGVKGDRLVGVRGEDARAHGVDSGDWVELESRRGKVRMRVKVADILPGHAFVPFHYGDLDAEDGPPRAANALTRAGWDAVSKQPHFKFCAARLKKLKGGP